MAKYSLGDIVEINADIEGKIIDILVGEPVLYSIQPIGYHGTMTLSEHQLTNQKWKPACQCGARFDRGFENIHSHFCPRWKKL